MKWFCGCLRMRAPSDNAVAAVAATTDPVAAAHGPIEASSGIVARVAAPVPKPGEQTIYVAIEGRPENFTLYGNFASLKDFSSNPITNDTALDLSVHNTAVHCANIHIRREVLIGILAMAKDNPLNRNTLGEIMTGLEELDREREGVATFQGAAFLETLSKWSAERFSSAAPGAVPNTAVMGETAVDRAPPTIVPSQSASRSAE